ncbi:MAG TPA: helix-turn-helix domain-containing protein [Thermomicrobiaceae bacterium]|nr:helix-turn-helix domain-containing protein [Thermomicrobiaceae bacterium]
MNAEHDNNPSCPIARAARVLGDHWTLLIVRDLAGGCRRFHELQASTGMSPSILSGRLRALEAAGMVSRRQFSEIPPRVEYTLTDMGRAALPIVDQLRRFGEDWLTDPLPPCPGPDEP